MGASTGRGNDRSNNNNNNNNNVSPEVKKAKKVVKEALGITATRGGYIASKAQNPIRYGGEASKITNEYLVSINEAKRTGGGGYMLTSKGYEIKYGSYTPGAVQDPGAMGTGNPGGVMSSVPISKKMLEEQNRIKSIALAGASVINPTASIVNTPLRMAANTASVDANNPQAAVDEYSRMFSAKQRGQPFTSNRNNLGMLNLTKNNKQKDQLGQ
tara:strand:+ start:8101 stop:8742 length:642 start_codon:yes stop_codon:yes gene_type:complete